MADRDSIDNASLDSLRRVGGDSLLRRMLDSFLTHSPGRVTAARAAVDQSDLGPVEFAAHALKSSAGQMGARDLQRICSLLESSSRQGDEQTSRRLVSELEIEYAQVERSMKRLLDELPRPE